MSAVVDENQRKRWDSLRAECALVGATLVIGTDGEGHPTFTVGRWAYSKTLNSEIELAAWLRMVGGRKGRKG